MIARCARCAPLLVVSFVASLAVVACGGGAAEKPAPAATAKKPDAKAPQDDAKETTKVEAKQDPVPDEQESQGGPSDGTPANEAADDGAEGADAAEVGGEGAEDAGAEGEAADADAAGDEAAGDEAADDGAADDGAADDGAAGAGKDAATLIKEARTTKTTDERAIAALAEAEEAGATIKVLARAAKARADYLYKAPDRAKVFYEWSAAKDEDYADPVFALAKQKAVTGDVEDVVKLLKQVSERKGGKKLLEQIDFDPTWDIVKDDPDVRALL